MSQLIPENKNGKPVDLSESLSLSTPEEAQVHYNKAVERMLQPVVWHELCGPLSAEFELLDSNLQPLRRAANTGDYLKIDIPGPGGSLGDKFDWVKVEAVEKNGAPEYNRHSSEESTGMRVRACPNPGGEEKETAHFFRHEATSTFIIQRKGNTVTAAYHGRNEVPNTDTGKVADNIRNTLISLGAMAGLSELQWKALLKGFLQE